MSDRDHRRAYGGIALALAGIVLLMGIITAGDRGAGR